MATGENDIPEYSGGKIGLYSTSHRRGDQRFFTAKGALTLLLSIIDHHLAARFNYTIIQNDRIRK